MRLQKTMEVSKVRLPGVVQDNYMVPSISENIKLRLEGAAFRAFAPNGIWHCYAIAPESYWLSDFHCTTIVVLYGEL